MIVSLLDQRLSPSAEKRLDLRRYQTGKVSPCLFLGKGNSVRPDQIGAYEPMDRIIRTTLVALMPRGIYAEDTSGFIDKAIAGEDPSLLHTFYRETEITAGEHRFFVKISKVINANEENDEWLHRVTKNLRDAGCENVAWKVTKISPDDCEPENTTESFPIDLFQSCVETDDMAIDLPKTPVEPFGSDAFWEFFDNDTE